VLIRKKIDIIEQFVMISFKIVLIGYILTHSFFLSFSTIFLCIRILLRFFFYLIYKNKSECFAMLDFLSVLWRILLLFIFLGISMNIDHFIDWSLKQVLLPFWVFFSVEIGLNLAVFLMLISKILQKLYEDVDYSEIIGLSWVFMQTFFYLLSGYLFLTGVIDFYDFGSQGFIFFVKSSFFFNKLSFLCKIKEKFDFFSKKLRFFY